MDFNTSNKDLRAILGNGAAYTVPRFQRDYSWSETEWRDLWDDIIASTNDPGEKHYMGYLVVQRKGENGFLVIDGQQRLTTISILVIAGLRTLSDPAFPEPNEEDRQKRIETLRASYVGTVDPVSLTPSNKLVLNRNNDRYYKRISKLEVPPQRRIKASERLLWKACEYFKRQIGKHCKTGEEVALLVDRMASRLFFTEIIVDDEVNAYRVFETLNARGVQLSTPDLLKNYLFSQIASCNPNESELDDLDLIWTEITSQLGSHSFARFVLAEWNRNHPLVRKGELFRKIKSSISDPASAASYVNNLAARSEVYAALHDPDDEFWSGADPSVRASLRTLRTFGITQPIGLLMSAHQHLASDFPKLLRWIAVVSIRWNVIGDRSTQFQEGIYNKASRAICDGASLREIAPQIQELQLTDEDIIDACAKKRFESKQSHKGARYLLARVEEHLNQGRTPLQDTELTLEHFLPQNPSPEWFTDTDLDEERIDDIAYRLGNLTLLSASANRDAGTLAPPKKQTLLKDSCMQISQLLTENAWDPDLIDRRGRWLGKHIAAVWRI